MEAREIVFEHSTDSMFDKQRSRFSLMPVTKDFTYRHLLGTTSDTYRVFRETFANGYNHVSLRLRTSKTHELVPTPDTTGICNQKGCHKYTPQSLHMCHVAYELHGKHYLAFIFACAGCNINETGGEVKVEAPPNYSPDRFIKLNGNASGRVYYRCYAIGDSTETCKKESYKCWNPVKMYKTNIRVKSDVTPKPGPCTKKKTSKTSKKNSKSKRSKRSSIKTRHL
jgi:hypothetical protein